MRIKALILIIIIGLVMALAFQNPAFAAITGVCSNCHTMHNSQNGTSMNWDNSATPNELLLRTDCFGCHGMCTPNKIFAIGGSNIPQVYHTDASGDLAGGNFAYITGVKGSGASDAKGHNVIELV